MCRPCREEEEEEKEEGVEAFTGACLHLGRLHSQHPFLEPQTLSLGTNLL